MPELVTAKPAEIGQVEERMCTHLAHLEAQGVEVFRFKDVFEPLRNDLWTRWSAIWQQVEGETAIEDGGGEPVSLVRLVRPDSGFEERQLLDKLLICVAESLERLENSRTRAYLEKLWAFLRSHAAEVSAIEPGAGPEKSKARGLPSRRKMAELLGIPRYRFPELYEMLREELEKCRSVLRLPLPGDERKSPTKTRDQAIIRGRRQTPENIFAGRSSKP